MKRLQVTLLALLLLSGCWSYREINELALVMAVGVDLTEDDRIRVTVQIARPGASGAAHGGTESTGPPVYIAFAEGRSVFEAIRNLALFSSRRIMWAHNKVIVIGGDMARRGIDELVDFFTRNPELRYRTLVAFTPGEAREILSLSTGMETQPSDSIDKAFRYAEIIGEARKVDVKEWAAAYMDPALTGVLPILRARERAIAGTAAKEADPREIVIQGLALLHEGKLAGLLDQRESRGVALTRARPGRIIITMPCSEEAGGQITLELVGSRSSIRPSLSQAGTPSFEIQLQVASAITSITCDVDYRQPKVRQQIERDLAQTLTEDITAVIRRARETRTDPMGLGQHLRARLPSHWPDLRNLWPEGIGEADIRVTVRAQVKGSELALRPGIYEREKRSGQ